MCILIISSNTIDCSISGNLSIFGYPTVSSNPNQLFDPISSMNLDLESFIRIKANNYVLELATQTHALELTSVVTYKNDVSPY